jgi:hypothetical protein
MKRTQLKKRGKSPESKLQKKCDQLMQEYYTKKYPKCDICNAPTYCMHHFIEKSRSNRLRYEPENLIPLCFKCHYGVHNACAGRILNNVLRSYNFMDAIINKRGGKEWKDKMERIGREMIKTNLAYYEQVYEKLSNYQP